jgi:kynurenine formamidase
MNTLLDLKKMKMCDLTHALSPNIPHWSGGCGFQSETIIDYADCADAVKFKVQKLDMFSGIGTHMDAPVHCIIGGKSIADIPLEDLIAPCIVIDVSTRSHEKYSVTPDDIEAFENQYGQIASGIFVIIRTGWEKHWHEPEKYRNNLIFPSLSKEAAEILVSRNIIGVGIDTLSPDRAEDGFPVHHLMLKADKYIIENVANAGCLPAVGAYIIVLPIKIQNGSEAPVRLIGLIT